MKDNFCIFFEAVALTATQMSAAVKVAKAQDVMRDIGAGKEMCVRISVHGAADATTGDETYEFDIVQSDNENLGNPDVLLQRVITAANLAVGDERYIDIPAGLITKAYMGVKAVLGGTTPAVTVTSDLVPKSVTRQYKTYAKGYEN